MTGVIEKSVFCLTGPDLRGRATIGAGLDKTPTTRAPYERPPRITAYTARDSSA